MTQTDDKHCRRQSGRTTRLLKEAIDLVKAGRAVYVIGTNKQHCWHLKNAADLLVPDVGIKFETPETLSNLDWETVSLKGAHPNCIVLVDHATIEARFSKLIEMLHRFD